MKKLRLSLAALALIAAVAGTATANAINKKADPCSKIDPKHEFCIGGTDEPCCEEGTIVYYYPGIR